MCVLKFDKMHISESFRELAYLRSFECFCDIDLFFRSLVGHLDHEVQFLCDTCSVTQDLSFKNMSFNLNFYKFKCDSS